ncbi:MAG: alkylphosphonate utilization protein [Bacteroidia bacterium]|nr:alkylphosphonate utilization protein [Bacteroidia bacterium]HQV01052.1 zinc ribbon domain-containing protein YjdM [Bacteroidia bacterium]
MSDILKCPACMSEYTYVDNDMLVCSQCFYEWSMHTEATNNTETEKILDANGNELQNGDSVIVVKDLPVKGAPKPVKAGTKVKNIRLNFESDHNIDCKIEGFGSMALKSEFVRKA